MFQIISGDGTPEVEQDRSTLFPSISVTLDGLSVTMGTSKYKQGEVTEGETGEGKKGKEAFMAKCFLLR